jgi:dihydroxyacetone kinase-like protein
MSAFANEGSQDIVLAMGLVIEANKEMLSRIDGEIGDGDHGVNMAKGFAMAAKRIPADAGSLSAALAVLGQMLLDEIGGSAGPLYGAMFLDMAEAIEGVEPIDAQAFADMLAAGLAAVQALGDVKEGDKTMLDTLIPATRAFQAAVAEGRPFDEALAALQAAALAGKEGTRDMVARIGRASRLGERSRGVLDAGATSCWLVLDTLAGHARQRLRP